MSNRSIIVSVAIAALAPAAGAQELTVNGGFEAGDTSGWQSFPTANSTFLLTNDSNSGLFAAELFNNDLASAGVIKQANIGMGLVQPGDEIQISFAAKGIGTVGGVLFAEMFSEIDGGGVSNSVILGGAPLAINNTGYTVFNFTYIAGPDVSGGITFQFAAVTGGAPGSTIVAFVDDVSVFRVPAPASAALLGLGGLAAVRRRR